MNNSLSVMANAKEEHVVIFSRINPITSLNHIWFVEKLDLGCFTTTKMEHLPKFSTIKSYKEHCKPASMSFIYRLYDNGVMVYVGRTTQDTLFARFQGHKDKIFDSYDYILVENEISRETERLLIETYRPKYNTTHAVTKRGVCAAKKRKYILLDDETRSQDEIRKVLSAKILNRVIKTIGYKSFYTIRELTAYLTNLGFRKDEVDEIFSYKSIRNWYMPRLVEILQLEAQKRQRICKW